MGLITGADTSRLRVEIGGVSFTEFTDATLDADVFAMADSFSCTGIGEDRGVSENSIPVFPGKWANVFINDTPVMRGVITKVTSVWGRSGLSFTFKGTDICGFLEMAQIRNYKTLTNTNILTAAKQLTSDLNWAGSLNFKMDGKVGMVLARKKFIAEPGQPIASTLSNLALMRGLLMWANSSGEIVFGLLKSGGEPEHSLTVGLDAVLDTSLNVALGASEIVVSSQDANNGSAREKYRVKVPGAGKFDLPIYMVVDSDESTPKALATARLEEVKRQMFTYEATVLGYTCGLGNVWGINRICRVQDAKNNVNGDFLVVSRSFSVSRSEGTKTKIVLAPLAEKRS